MSESGMIRRAGHHAFVLVMLLSLLLLGGCAAASAHLKTQPHYGEVIFLANTSPVSFQDLISIDPIISKIYRKSRFEGTFDSLYDLSEVAAILNPLNQRKRRFTPEAEWVLLFKNPMAADGPELTEREFNDRVATFTGMVEGKWIDKLQANGARDWRAASCGNNFYRSNATPLPYKSIDEWSRLLALNIPSEFDDAEVVISHPTIDGQPERLCARFGCMRRELFGPPQTGNYQLEPLAYKVYRKFREVAHREGRTDLKLKGINLGLHGERGGLVNYPVYGEKKIWRREHLEWLQNFIPLGMRVKTVAQKIDESKLCLKPGTAAEMNMEVRLGQPIPCDKQYFAFAIYDQRARLVKNPIPSLIKELRRRKITDVYVVSHGWNFTLDESIGLMDHYQSAILLKLRDTIKAMETEARRQGLDYEPFFILVNWVSVARPTSEVVNALTLLDPKPGVADFTKGFDNIVHVTSTWGKSKNAARLALGDFHPERYDRNEREILNIEKSVYHLASNTTDDNPAKFENLATIDTTGRDIPLYLLIEQLMLMKHLAMQGTLADAEHFKEVKIHTSGHSFGAKVICLAALETIVRAKLTWLIPARGQNPRYGDGMIDTMILFNPAMTEREMFGLIWQEYKKQKPSDQQLGKYKLEFFENVAHEIAVKAVVYTHHDSATGWLYLASDLLINHYRVLEYS